MNIQEKGQVFSYRCISDVCNYCWWGLPDVFILKHHEDEILGSGIWNILAFGFDYNRKINDDKILVVALILVILLACVSRVVTNDNFTSRFNFNDEKTDLLTA